VIFRRARFASVIETQLDLFVRDRRAVLDEIDARLLAYNEADRDVAEELYGDYVDAVETGTELLADVRDHYAATLADPERYVEEFNRAVARRLPALALEIENR
jgi:hypothetical protein